MKNSIRTNRIFKLTLLLLLWMTAPLHLAAQTAPADSIRLSLLTCAPGEEIYSLFGHTAIRYEYPARGIDVVFNYGMFSFNTPNFMLRFALGQTDYQLGVTDYQRFAAEYDYFERSVWQQTLNLTQEEKTKLIALLETNYQPENRTYRYNFFDDNCATRPRDIIEESIAGKVNYAADDTNAADDTKTMGDAQAIPSKSFRDLIHECTQGHPWAQFGIDFCIGSEADHPITDRQKMFAPYYLMNFFSNAQIKENGTHENEESRPLILHTEKVVDCEKQKKNELSATDHQNQSERNHLPTPLQGSLLLFILIAAATIYGLKKRKSLWGIDLLLFAIAGIAGCIIAFLALFSEHPAVSANFLLLVFHPLQLLALPWMLKAERKGRRSGYHLFNLAVLTFFIALFPLIPQRFDLAVVPLALCLLIRSASNVILTYKRKK